MDYHGSETTYGSWNGVLNSTEVEKEKDTKPYSHVSNILAKMTCHNDWHRREIGQITLP